MTDAKSPKKCVLITPKGEFILKEVKNDHIELSEMYKWIECNLIDIQEAGWTKYPFMGHLLVFDDEFLYTDKPEINFVASILFGCLEHGQVLCGNVILAQEADDGHTDGFSNQELVQILEYLDIVKEEVRKRRSAFQKVQAKVIVMI